MRTPVMIMKQEFIKKWTTALRTCCTDTKKEMCVTEKKNVIKQTAAIAMAAAKHGSTAWSRAILADGYNNNNEILIAAVTADSHQNPTKFNKHLCIKQRVVRRSKRMMIRGTRSRSMSMDHKEQKASSLAKSLVKQQTRVLKTLLPGGGRIDECCLIEEALDYIVSLKAQVDVMKELVTAAEYIKNKNPSLTN